MDKRYSRSLAVQRKWQPVLAKLEQVISAMYGTDVDGDILERLIETRESFKQWVIAEAYNAESR